MKPPTTLIHMHLPSFTHNIPKAILASKICQYMLVKPVIPTMMLHMMAHNDNRVLLLTTGTVAIKPIGIENKANVMMNAGPANT
jgi:hypothetical protein